jgi:hypothetical protein
VDISSPEVTAGRAIAVVAIEQLIRTRTALVVWCAAVIAGLLVVGAVVSDGLGAVLVGIAALVAASVAVTLFAIRAVVLRALRRFGGGPDFARVRPIVERHLAEDNRARGVVFDRPGAARLAWRVARRPGALQDEVRETASVLARTAPNVVAEVRGELQYRHG